MIEDSSKHAFDYVIVYTLDRFSRNRYDSAVYKYKLKKNGVRVLSAKEKIADDPSGIILESVIEGCSEYFLADLAQKVKRGMLENVINGKWPGGNIPYGFYLGPDKHLHFNHEQISGVRLIFSLLSSGQKYSSIVKTLNEKGYRTSFNKPWTRNSLSHIARNPIYIGTFNYQGQAFKNYVPPMVSLADFDAVQRMFNKRKRTGLVSPKSSNYALLVKIIEVSAGALIRASAALLVMAISIITIHAHPKITVPRKASAWTKNAVRKTYAGTNWKKLY